MVLTKAELIASLQNEVRILLHLMTKVDRSKLDYRPTPKQRSTLELLRYLTMMGPSLTQAAKDNTFDTAAWTAAEEAANGLDFDQATQLSGLQLKERLHLPVDVGPIAARWGFPPGEKLGDVGVRHVHGAREIVLAATELRQS